MPLEVAGLIALITLGVFSGFSLIGRNFSDAYSNATQSLHAQNIASSSQTALLQWEGAMVFHAPWTKPQHQTLELHNIGPIPSNLESLKISVEGAGFRLEHNACETLLQPQTSCEVLISFSPTQADDSLGFAHFTLGEQTETWTMIGAVIP